MPQLKLAAHLFTAWIPELNLTILLNQLQQLKTLLQRQVLAPFRRQRRLTLGDLTQFNSGDHQAREIELDAFCDDLKNFS